LICKFSYLQSELLIYIQRKKYEDKESSGVCYAGDSCGAGA
jgi:hypothetical protein